MQTLGRSHRRPAFALPEHAADCHMHVFGPFERFPLAAERAYNVAEAPVAAHERMKQQVGIERTVFVQADGAVPYGGVVEVMDVVAGAGAGRIGIIGGQPQSALSTSTGSSAEAR